MWNRAIIDYNEIQHIHRYSYRINQHENQFYGTRVNSCIFGRSEETEMTGFLALFLVPFTLIGCPIYEAINYYTIMYVVIMFLSIGSIIGIQMDLLKKTLTTTQTSKIMNIKNNDHITF